MTSQRSRLSSDQTLGILDAATAAKGADGVPLLPLRGHLFMRTQAGLWACVNEKCTGRSGTPLEGTGGSSDWMFGKLFFQHRERCDACESRVFELVQCSTCGQPYLAAEEGTGATAGVLQAVAWGSPELDADEGPEDEGQESAAASLRHLLVGPKAIEGASTAAQPFDTKTGTIGAGEATTAWLLSGQSDSGQSDGRLVCARCRTKDTAEGEQFRVARLGSPFYLGIAVPTVLEQTEPMEKGTVLPAEGRRMLTFSDSRQGTARFALRAQLEGERNATRAIIYHTLQRALRDASTGPAASPEDIAKLEQQLAQVKAANLDIAVKAIEEKLKGLRAPPPAPALAWTDVREKLAGDTIVRDWMLPRCGRADR